MLIDNTELARSFMRFDENEPSRYYYKFSVLVRRKDYPDGSCPVLAREGSREACIRQWLVSSVENYDKTLPDMLTFMNLFHARLYMTADRKDLYKTLIQARNEINSLLDSAVLGQCNASSRNLNRLINSVTSISESSSRNGKCWLFDVDTKDEQIVQGLIKTFTDSYISTFTTKSGFHVVAKRNFNAHALTLPEAVELKENAAILVAMY